MLTEKELTHFKNQLVQMKQEMLKVIEANDPLPFESYGELTSFDNHFADTASQMEDRQLQLSIKDRAQHILDEINDAIDRTENGTFGKCVDTGKDIPIDRLKAIPYAKRTLEAQLSFDEAVQSSQQSTFSFATPKDGTRGDDRIRTADEIINEHGNSSNRKV